MSQKNKFSPSDLICTAVHFNIIFPCKNVGSKVVSSNIKHYLTGRGRNYLQRWCTVMDKANTQKYKLLLTTELKAEPANNETVCVHVPHSSHGLIPRPLECRPAFTAFLSGSIQPSRPWAQPPALNLLRTLSNTCPNTYRGNWSIGFN